LKPPPGVSTVWLALFLNFMMLSLALLFDQVTRAPCSSSGLGVNHADI
jgi:hypothetical protein